MPNEWFDSHCHLHICEEDSPVEKVLEDATLAGVAGLVTIGIDQASSRRSIELARQDRVWATVGVHPNSSSGWNDSIAVEIDGLAVEPGVVAVGETGLDFYRDRAPATDQARAFSDHIAIAKRHDKALVIHTRASLPEALDQLEEEGPPPRTVFHCWSGSEDELRRASALDAYISFAGNVSFKNAEPLRRVLPLVPESRLLIETDAPYLTPVPHRGKPNSPANVGHVGAAVAATLGTDPKDLAALTGANARRLFALP